MGVGEAIIEQYGRLTEVESVTRQAVEAHALDEAERLLLSDVGRLPWPDISKHQPELDRNSCLQEYLGDLSYELRNLIRPRYSLYA